MTRPEAQTETREIRLQADLPSADTPLVSVAMTAYNREATLAKAVESVLMQRTNFRVEIVIGDDCSTDGTLAVAEVYRQRYPAVIRILRRQVNAGIQRNYRETSDACVGKYIAWLDSDDLWTDPEKLAIQVEVLEKDPSIALVGHTARWVTPEGVVTRPRYPESLPAGRYGMEQILHSCFFPSPSIMFHNGLQHGLPAWYNQVPPLTDWPLYFTAAKAGALMLLERNMADYTLSINSAMRGQGDLYWYLQDVKFYELLDQELTGRYRRIARYEKSKRYESLAYFMRKEGDFPGSRQAAVKALLSPAWQDNLPGKLKAVAASLVREGQWRMRGARPGVPT